VIEVRYTAVWRWCPLNVAQRSPALSLGPISIMTVRCVAVWSALKR